MFIGLQAAAEWDTRIVEFNTCGEELVASSLRSHLLTRYEVSQVADIDLTELKDGDGRTFVAHWLVERKTLFCPILGYMDKATSTWNLCCHLNDRHPLDLVSMPGKGVYHRYRL